MGAQRIPRNRNNMTPKSRFISPASSSMSTQLAPSEVPQQSAFQLGNTVRCYFQQFQPNNDNIAQVQK